MNKCKLCNINDADKKGSHVVPAFFMKRIDNEIGEKDREKTLGFKITETETKSYFGRGVQPEKLVDTYGKITDELIDNNNIDYIVDNYFCAECENKFSIVENEYANTIECKVNNGNYQSMDKPFIGFLFWISIVWRLSIQVDSGFKLKMKDENKLGRLLKKYLKPKLNQIELDIDDDDLKNIGYKLIRSINFSDDNSTWLTWSTAYQRPYSFIIDEYFLFVYFKDNYLKGMIMDFYDTYKHQKLAFYNKPFNNEIIFGLSHEQYQEISNNIANFGAKKTIDSLNMRLDLTFQKVLKKKMPPDLKREIINNIVNSDLPLGIKYTNENQKKIIKETLMKRVKT